MSSGVLNEGQTGQKYHRDPNLTLDQSVDSIATYLPLVFEPGTKMAYDGTMMHVMGKVVEVIDSINGNNRDWNTIAKEEFFDILGMDSTYYDKFLPNPAVAGGIQTTPKDYLTLLKMISNNGMHEGSQFLSPQSAAEIFTLQYGESPVYIGGTSLFPFHHPDYANGLDTSRYSYGGWVIERDVISDDPLVVTSPGAYGTFPWMDKCRNMYGILFTYVPAGGAQKIMDTYLRMMRLLREEVGGCLGTGFQEIIASTYAIEVYPNPVTDNILNLKSNTALSNGHLKVVGPDGRVVLQQEINEEMGEATVQLPINVANGLYFISIVAANEYYFLKIVVNR